MKACVLMLGSLSVTCLAVTGAAPASDAPSVAYELATIDCHCVPSATRVAAYARVLRVLVMSKCKEPSRTLADYSVTSVRLLAKKGVRMTNLRMLRLVNMSIPSKLGRTRCRDIFAALVTLTGG